MRRTAQYRRWIAAAVLAAVPGILWCGTNGVVEGIIKDSRTGDRLVSVTVRIAGSPLGTVSDADGFYQVNNVRSGVYDISYSIVGYRTVIMKGVSVYADLRTRVDVEMEQTTVQMDAVEIFSQRPLIQKDQPASIFSIGSVKIEKMPVSTFRDLLTLQPGSTLEGNVRGGKVNEVLYLVDGLPVQDYIGGGLGVEIPRSSISGMTIFTGGFDAEYGNAMSGIVNVVTRGGENRYRASVRFEKDNWLSPAVDKQVDKLTECEIGVSGPIVDNTVFFLNALTLRGSNTRWWQDMDDFFNFPIDKQLNDFAKIDYTISPSMRLALQGIVSLREWRDYEFSWRYNLDGLPERSTSSVRGSAILTAILSDRSAMTLSLTRYSLKNKIGSGSAEAIPIDPYQYDLFLQYVVDGRKNWWSNTEQVINSVKGDITSQIDNTQLVKAGFNLDLYTIDAQLVKYEPQRTYFGKPIENAPLLNYSNAYRYFPRSGSIFVEDKFRFDLDGSILNLGMRWDFLDPRATRPLVEFIPTSNVEFTQQVTGFRKASLKHQFSPRIAFAAPTGPNSIIFANFGKYFQYPLFDYLYSGIDPSQIRQGAKNVLTGNPDLEPEQTTAWELGYKHSLGRSYVASVTYFRKNIKNQVDSKTLIPFDSKAAGDYGFAQYVNNAEADAEGIEIVLSRENDERLSGSISYTFMSAEGTSEVVNQAINLAQWGFPINATSYPLSWDQRHTVKADLETHPGYGLTINGIIWYNSPKPYTFFPTRDGFTPVDPAKDFVPNNARMRDVVIVNLKISETIPLSTAGSLTVILYADIRNAFNTRNVKWIDSNGRIGGELSDPSAYYDLRRVRAGITVEL